MYICILLWVYVLYELLYTICTYTNIKWNSACWERKEKSEKNPLKPSRLGIVVKIANEVSKIVYLYI